MEQEDFKMQDLYVADIGDPKTADWKKIGEVTNGSIIPPESKKKNKYTFNKGKLYSYGNKCYFILPTLMVSKKIYSFMWLHYSFSIEINKL